MPLDSEPADVTARVEAYDEWLAHSPEVPKLLLTFSPGPSTMLGPEMIAWCAANISSLDIAACGPAGHHAPEDQPDATVRSAGRRTIIKSPSHRCLHSSTRLRPQWADCMFQPVAQTRASAPAPQDLALLSASYSRYGGRDGVHAVYATGWFMLRRERGECPLLPHSARLLRVVGLAAGPCGCGRMPNSACACAPRPGRPAGSRSA